jgi:hypothetical protein
MSAESRRPKLDDAARLRHMLDAARRALELAQGKKVSSLDPEAETALALTRLLEILGEAAKNVTPEPRFTIPRCPGGTLPTPATVSFMGTSMWTTILLKPSSATICRR